MIKKDYNAVEDRLISGQEIAAIVRDSEWIQEDRKGIERLPINMLVNIEMGITDVY
mgnify:CR=1 FL=1